MKADRILVQCDQIGRFFKFSNKSSQNICVTFRAILKYATLQVKISVVTFSATFGYIGLLCIPTSGHTVLVDGDLPYS